MKISFLGPVGSFTEEAAKLSHSGTHLPQSSIEAVFASVANCAADRGVVPFENVIQGYVTETLDALYTFAETVHVIDSHMLPIAHALGALPQHGPLTQILSKDQALHQCSEFLRTHYAAAALVETPSTSHAMQHIVDQQLLDAGAIGSPAGLAHYGLQILHNPIGNIPHNKTRFLTLAGTHVPPGPRTGRDATALVIYPHHDRVGLLQEILAIVSSVHGLSCSSIQSRPDTRGAFRFYLELEGHLQDPALTACLQDLRTQVGGATVEVKVCGSYPRRAFNAPRIHTLTLVGGTGRMGQWFQEFFRRAGCSVGVSDEHTDAATLSRLLRSSDAVLINVPMAQASSVIRQVAPQLRAGQLLVDNTGIKSQTMAAMGETAPEGVEVLGMHTLFGPSIGARLRHENIIFIRPPNAGDLASEFEGLFLKYGARVQHTDAQNHDRHMALHQNLEHFSKMVLAQVITQWFAEPGALQHYASPNSRASLATLGRMLSGDPALYAEIQLYNPQALSILEAYVQAAQQLLEVVRRGDHAAIVSTLRAARQTLGEPFVQTMLALSKTYSS